MHLLHVSQSQPLGFKCMQMMGLANLCFLGVHGFRCVKKGSIGSDISSFISRRAEPLLRSIPGGLCFRKMTGARSQAWHEQRSLRPGPITFATQTRHSCSPLRFPNLKLPIDSPLHRRELNLKTCAVCCVRRRETSVTYMMSSWLPEVSNRECVTVLRGKEMRKIRDPCGFNLAE